MARKQPVTIEGIQFDALIHEEYTMEASSPDYVVESGYTISDSIILSAEILNMTLFVSDKPVTFKNLFGSGGGRVEQVVKAMKDLYYAKKLVSVTTSEAQYDNMAIESLTVSRTNEYGYAKEIPIKLKHIRITESQTTTIPESYGKSGATGAAAGPASTSTGSSGSGKSGGSSGNSNGSILYNVASSIGLI